MTHKTCKKCSESKPLADFKRRLTRAQALARGYKGERLVTIESSMCKPCQPRKRKLTELTAKELQNRVAHNDISVLDKRLILEERKRMHVVNSAIATRNRWVETWARELRSILKPLKAEIASASAQARYADKKGQMERQEFFAMYDSTLRQQLARIELDYARNPRRVTSSRWEEMLDKNTAPDMRDAWGGLPIEDRALVKIPALVLYRGD
jgi:hypothetical protein